MNTHSFNQLFKFTILGSGSSSGTPLIGCDCAVCLSTDHRNQRLRTSLLITTPKGKNILIDTSPDLRQQFLRHPLKHLDGVIITHEHADHTHGIDDLRPIMFRQQPHRIPVVATAETSSLLHQRFSYLFRSSASLSLNLQALPPFGIDEIHQTTLWDEEWFFFTYPHGVSRTMGFVVGSMAYIVDCHELSSHYLQFLQSRKLKWLIIDCIREEPHSSHLHLKQSLNYIRQISPQKAGLIHLSHQLEHATLQKRLQQKEEQQQDQIKIDVLYDGQVFTLDGMETKE
jgi:phosphoribosyl 1,2-cyclic phosphate phosphodiesterase